MEFVLNNMTIITIYILSTIIIILAHDLGLQMILYFDKTTLLKKCCKIVISGSAPR